MHIDNMYMDIFVVVVWLLSRVWLFCNPMDCSPPSSSVHGISRQEYWSGLPFPPPGDLPDPGIKPMSPALQANFLPTEPPGKPWSSCLRACSRRVPETADGWEPSSGFHIFTPGFRDPLRWWSVQKHIKETARVSRKSVCQEKSLLLKSCLKSSPVGGGAAYS